MKSIISESKNFSSLVNPSKDKIKPIYRWHSFKHSFSKELVDSFLNEFNLNNKNKVLDPFVGGGTTLLACKEKAIGAVGLDISPFSVFLTRTKTDDYSKDKLNTYFIYIQDKISRSCIKKDYKLPDIPLLEKAFRKDIWNEIILIKKIILSIKSQKYQNFFLLALLSILEEVSNTSKAGGFLRITEKEIIKDSVRKRFYEYASTMIEDIADKTNGKRNSSSIKVFKGDARKLNIKDKFDAVITSPPYPNRHDYTRIYALELALNFIKNNDELKKLRYKTLRSHVEAKKFYNSNGYKKPSELSDIIDRIKNNGINNSQIISMIEGYFEDMYLCLKEMKRILNKNGRIALVVSNVRYSGINIKVDEILGKLGEQVGLKLNEIRVARLRGNSSQQMRDYKRNYSRESIIIWSKKIL